MLAELKRVLVERAWAIIRNNSSSLGAWSSVVDSGISECGPDNDRIGLFLTVCAVVSAASVHCFNPWMSLGSEQLS